MAENQNIEYKESWRDEYLGWVCAFANSQGGKLYIGVNDGGEVVGVANSHRLLEDIPNKIVTILGLVCDVNLLVDLGKHYLEIVVEPSNVPISFKGEYHVRSGATKQVLKGNALQQFLLKKNGLSWDDITHPTATFDCIDDSAVAYFVRMAVMAQRLPQEALSYTSLEVLQNLNLIGEDGKLKLAAILLFGKNPNQYFVANEFKIGRFVNSESDLVIQDVIEGNLLQMAEKVLDVLKSKYLVAPISYEGLHRKETLEIPEAALREAIYNAIVHKDYTGAAIQMKVWNDKVELWNDGSLPDGYTIDTLFSKHTSKPRNKNLANVFYKAGFIESWGRGIDKIRLEMQSAGLSEPRFEEICGGMMVTFYRGDFFAKMYKDKQNDTINDTENDTISDTESDTKNRAKKVDQRHEEIVKAIKNEPLITSAQLALKLGVSQVTIKRDLKKLAEKGMVVFVGLPQSGHWELTNRNKVKK